MSEPLKSDDIPVTKRMLDDSFNDIKRELAIFRTEMREGFKSILDRSESYGSAITIESDHGDASDKSFYSMHNDNMASIEALNESITRVEKQNAELAKHRFFDHFPFSNTRKNN